MIREITLKGCDLGTIKPAMQPDIDSRMTILEGVKVTLILVPWQVRRRYSTAT